MCGYHITFQPFSASRKRIRARSQVPNIDLYVWAATAKLSLKFYLPRSFHLFVDYFFIRSDWAAEELLEFRLDDRILFI